MFTFDPDDDRSISDQRGETGPALKEGAMLHALALRYWADGHLDDAVRLDLQARDIVRPVAPTSTWLADIDSAVEAITQELRSTAQLLQRAVRPADILAIMAGRAGA